MKREIYDMSGLFTQKFLVREEESPEYELIFYSDPIEWLLSHLLAATYDNDIFKVFEKVYSPEQIRVLQEIVCKTQDSLCYSTMFGRLFSIMQYDLAEFVQGAKKCTDNLPSVPTAFNDADLKKVLTGVGGSFVKTILIYTDEEAPSLSNSVTAASFLLRSDLNKNSTKKDWLPDDVLYSVLCEIEKEAPKNEFGFCKVIRMFAPLINTSEAKLELQICSLMSHALYCSGEASASHRSFDDVVLQSVKEAKRYAN